MSIAVALLLGVAICAALVEISMRVARWIERAADDISEIF